MNLHTLLAFENELEKLAEEDLSTFEKHPKKFIGAGAVGAAGLAGAARMLLSKGKRGGGGGGGGGGGAVKKALTKAKDVVESAGHKAPAVHVPKAKTPARKMTHDEILEARKTDPKSYPGYGPKTTDNQSQKHLGEEAIQAAREHGMRAGMSTDEHRAVTHVNDVAKWLKKNKKSTT